MTKSIAYAYPTSSMAQELGFYKTGCYFVAVQEPDTPKGMPGKVAHKKGFALYSQAFAYAETLTEEYDYYSINVYGAKNGFVNCTKQVREFHLGEKS